MTYDARAVANRMLDLAERRRLPLSLMSLLKLMYYAHGWHLAKSGKPLCRPGFEAWENGPVIRCVWEALKGQASNPVKQRAEKYDPLQDEWVTATSTFSEEDERLLDQVLGAFGHLSGPQLSDLTHEEDTPWHRVWHGGGRVTFGMRIDDELILEYFRRDSPKTAAH